MADKERPGLELEIDDALQRREVRLQRAGWAFLGVLILAALAGLTGGGPLADARLQQGGVDLQWERIVRAEAKTELRLEAPSSLARDGYLGVRLNRKWIESMEVEEVRPEPERVAAADEYIEYLFAVPPGATSTSAAFTVRPQVVGRQELTVATSDAPAFNVRQFVLP